jgi:SAM-dependent methyltransferase
VLPATRERCEALLAASQQQHSEIANLLAPLVPPATGQAVARRDEPLPSLLTNIHYLFRDWGWPPLPDDENARTLAAARRALGPGTIGRTIVLGAGACRLASELHRDAGASETIALDIDALLLVVADRVLGGGTAQLTEGYVDINELQRPATSWTLRAPALAGDRFHLVMADGLRPPFFDGAFDTVVTPWFIDAIPSDLRDAIGAVARLLRPGGRWVCIGPLRYAADVPIARRFSREEVFDLAGRAGLPIVRWEAATQLSLVSPQTGRGKLEWVMSFCAVRNPTIDDAPDDEPPNWLLFGHIPIPAFDSGPAPADALTRTVLAAIDGRRTLDELTDKVAAEIGPATFSRHQLREAVRQCIAERRRSARR